jgi:hypothetical protein
VCYTANLLYDIHVGNNPQPTLYTIQENKIESKYSTRPHMGSLVMKNPTWRNIRSSSFCHSFIPQEQSPHPPRDAVSSPFGGPQQKSPLEEEDSGERKEGFDIGSCRGLLTKLCSEREEARTLNQRLKSTINRFHAIPTKSLLFCPNPFADSPSNIRLKFFLFGQRIRSSSQHVQNEYTRFQ